MSQHTTDEFRVSCGAAAPLELSISGPGWAGSKRHLSGQPFVLVGRHERSCLRLEDEAVSRRHAYLQRLGDRVFCVDLGSRTGIRWGGEPRPAGWLRPEQGVQIGPFTLELATAARSGEGPCDTGVEDGDPLQDRIGAPRFGPRITVEMGNKVRARLHLNRALVLVGSSPACRIRLRDAGISRYHCSLVRTPQGVWLIDLLHGSGTCLNGQPIGWALLKEGDRLQVGPYVLRVWDLVLPSRESRARSEEAQQERLAIPVAVPSSLLALHSAELDQARERQQEIETLRQQLADNQAECRQYREQARALEIQIAGMAGLQSRLVAAEAGVRELDVVRGERERWQAEAHNLQARLAGIEAEREQLGHLAADLRAAQAERDRMQAEQERSQRAAEQARVRASDLERALVEAASTHRTALDEAHARWEEERQGLEVRLELERQRHDEAIQAAVRNVQARAAAEWEEWRQQLEAVQQQLAGEREAACGAGARLEQESAILREVRADLAARSAEHDVALRRLQALQGELARARNEAHSLQTELAQALEHQRDIEALKQQLAYVRAEHAQLCAHIPELEGRANWADRLWTQLQDADAETEQLRVQLRAAESREAELGVVRAECEQFREQANALQVQVAGMAGLQARLEAAEARIRELDVVRSERDRWQAEARDLRAGRAAADAEREEWRQRLETAQQQLVGEREAVRATDARLEQESAALRKVRDDLAARNAEHGVALQRLQELRDDFVRSQDEVRRLRAERDHVRESQRDVEILRQQLIDSQAECGRLREQAHAQEVQAAEAADQPAPLEAAEASAPNLDDVRSERTPGTESEQAEHGSASRGGKSPDAASGVNPLPELAAIPPARRPELLLCPLGDQGKYVLKDVRAGAYYHLGEQEAFLLSRLDGQQTTAAICAAFEARFGEPLSPEDLRGFLEMARAQGFLQAPSRAGGQARSRQSILFWRISLFDPDRLFNWLAPKIGFLWTRAFLAISLVAIVAAAGLVWANRQEMAGSLMHAWRWETLVLAWLLVAVMTTCHEFAHGLTCKHYGGEVHEVGFLLLFFMPCFYCNVSDAWLIREKSKRLWVTLAGGYCDLCLGALAVFAWRLTLPHSLPNYLAWVALTILGARIFFNFNPLLKLDGYYLLSDALEVPNLRQRAWEQVMGQLRWLLWGAPRPAAEARGKFLLLYGAASWVFSLVFLALMIAGFWQFLGARWGLVGGALAALLGVVTFRGMFRGFAGGEIRKMIRVRRKRTLMWVVILAAAAALLCLGEVEDRSSGPFQVRPASRAEVRAPVAGFLQAVSYEEGDRVYVGAVLAHLEVPDLASRRKQKRAQIRETRAQLRLLEIGPRPEEVLEQRHRVQRAEKWRDLAEQDLRRASKALQEDLERLDKQIAQYSAERDHAQVVLNRAMKLQYQNAVSTEEFEMAQKQCRVLRSQEEQARARKRVRLALGCVESEAELARREKDLADARGTLALLEAGTRPEEIEAERARLARLEEEDCYLERLQEKLQVHSSVAGLITTPHLKEKVGHYLQEGELICEVEEPAESLVEITLAEQDVARVDPGQVVELKVRALPFQTFLARVERVAPRAVEVQTPLTPLARGEAPGTVTVYCRPEQADLNLRPGMTGYGRIYCGRRRIGEVVADRLLRYVRTEFWW